MKKILLTSVILLSFVWSGLSWAHSEHFTKSARSPQKAYEFRTSAMTLYKWYLSPMGAMVKGKVKFDAKSFAKYANGLEIASELDLLQGFPQKSSEDEIDDSNAKPAIWKNSKDFEKKFEALQVEAKKLVSIANKGDEKAIKAQFKITAATCSSCHKKYKTK